MCSQVSVMPVVYLCMTNKVKAITTEQPREGRENLSSIIDLKTYLYRLKTTQAQLQAISSNQQLPKPSKRRTGSLDAVIPSFPPQSLQKNPKKSDQNH